MTVSVDPSDRVALIVVGLWRSSNSGAFGSVGGGAPRELRQHVEELVVLGKRRLRPRERCPRDHGLVAVQIAPGVHHRRPEVGGGVEHLRPCCMEAEERILDDLLGGGSRIGQQVRDPGGATPSPARTARRVRAAHRRVRVRRQRTSHSIRRLTHAIRSAMSWKCLELVQSRCLLSVWPAAHQGFIVSKLLAAQAGRRLL